MCVSKKLKLLLDKEIIFCQVTFQKIRRGSREAHTYLKIILIKKLKQSEDDEVEDEETYVFFTSKLKVSRVVYTTVPIEYPDTSPEQCII